MVDWLYTYRIELVMSHGAINGTLIETKSYKLTHACMQILYTYYQIYEDMDILCSV